MKAESDLIKGRRALHRPHKRQKDPSQGLPMNHTGTSRWSRWFRFFPNKLASMANIAAAGSAANAEEAVDAAVGATPSFVPHESPRPATSSSFFPLGDILRIGRHLPKTKANTND